MVEDLHDHDIFTLWDARVVELDRIVRISWISSNLLELEGDKVVDWEEYIKILYSNFIWLQQEAEDTLIWSRNEKTGQFTTKLGYHGQVEVQFEGNKMWWWKFVWANYAPK